MPKPPGQQHHVGMVASHHVAVHHEAVHHDDGNHTAVADATPTPKPPSLEILRLPFGILGLAIQELSSQLSVELTIPESDAFAMTELAVKLQELASTAGSKTNLAKSYSGDDLGSLKLAASDVVEALAAQEDEKAVHSVSFEEPEFETGDVRGLEDWQQQLVGLFEDLDEDKSGTLSTAELRQALISAGVPQARLAKLLREADADDSGDVDLKEWVHVVTHSDIEEIKTTAARLSVAKLTSGSIFAKEKQPSRCMMNPLSHVRLTWDFFVFGLCMYIAVALPFTMAFEGLIRNEIVTDALILIETCIDGVFLVDVVFNFRTGYVNENSEVIMDWKDVTRTYMRTWFLLDFCSSFPFEALFPQGDITNLQVAKLLKIGKLTKVLKMLRPRNAEVSEISGFMESFEQNKWVRLLMRRGSVVLNMLMLMHWMSCGMKMVDEGFLRDYEGGTIAGDLAREYLAASYWSLTTLTTTGYGDMICTSDNERLFTMASMLIGGGFYGYILGSIMSIVTNMDLNTSAYYERMDLIHAWLAHHRLPMELKKVTRRYFKSYLSEKSAINEAAMWGDLSPELQKQIGEHIVNENVKFNPLFDGLNLGTVVRLQSILRTVTILPDRLITMKGEAGTAMYIIRSGRVKLQLDVFISSRDRQLEPGQSFGEEILLGVCECYEYTTTALERSKFEMILEDEFLGLFQSMPNVLDRMKANCIKLHPHLADGGTPSLL